MQLPWIQGSLAHSSMSKLWKQETLWLRNENGGVIQRNWYYIRVVPEVQSVPVKPAMQMHVKPPKCGEQILVCGHGFMRQKSISEKINQLHQIKISVLMVHFYPRCKHYLKDWYDKLTQRTVWLWIITGDACAWIICSIFNARSPILARCCKAGSICEWKLGFYIVITCTCIYLESD